MIRSPSSPNQADVIVPRVRATIDTVLAWVLTALVGLSVINVLWQVFTRWILQDPSSYTEELARYLLIWIGLIGSAYAVGLKLHLAIELLPERLEGRARDWLELVIQVFVFAFALAVMVVGGYQLVTLTLRFEQTSAALGLPLGYVYSVVPISGLIIMFYAADSITGCLRLLRGQPADVKAPERTTTRPID